MNERARRLAVLAAAHLAFAAAALLMTRPAAVSWERSWLDGAFRFRGARAAKAPVVLAAIDDKSLAELGPWPWPRGLSARLVDRLTAAGARTIAFDVMFAEPRSAADDKALVEATRRSGRVIHGYAVSDARLADPIPGLAEASAGMASLRMGDGPLASRCLAPFSPERGGTPFLGAAAAARQLGLTPAELRARLDPVICLNFRGARPYPILSAADILKDRLPDEQKLKFRDAAVFVGFVSDAIAYDHWASPFDVKAPGVEVHATAFDNIVSGDSLRKTGRFASFLIVYLAALAAALPFLISRNAGIALGGAAVIAALAAAPLGLKLIVAPYGALAAAAAASYLACLVASASRRRP